MGCAASYQSNPWDGEAIDFYKVILQQFNSTNGLEAVKEAPAETKIYIRFLYYARSTEELVTSKQNANLAALNKLGVEGIEPGTMTVGAMVRFQYGQALRQAGSTPGSTFKGARIGEEEAFITRENLKYLDATQLSKLASLTSAENPLNVLFLCVHL